MLSFHATLQTLIKTAPVTKEINESYIPGVPETQSFLGRYRRTYVFNNLRHLP